MKQLQRVLIVLAPLLLLACKHTLEVEGQGDIVEILDGARGCSLEEFQAGFSNCTNNDVFEDERVIYRGMPRPGWRFSHWDGICSNESQGDDCELSYVGSAAQSWDEQFPDSDAFSLRAVFAQDGDTLEGDSYIASRLGAEGQDSYSSLLDAIFDRAGSYRYTTQQGSTRPDFDRNSYLYERRSDSRMLASESGGVLVSAGGATAGLAFMAMVDTDNADNDISTTYLMPKLSDAGAGLFLGSYYCGHISSRAPGYARYFKATMYGNNDGDLQIISDRFGESGITDIDFQVFSDGTTTLDYQGLRLAGSISADGSVFTGAEISDSGRGIGICLRSSVNQTLLTVQGSYYGAWMNLYPSTAVTDILVDATGTTSESVLRDSFGGREYFLAQDFMLVKNDGRIDTQSHLGAVSPDGRIMFVVNTSGSQLPRLAMYVKKT